MTLTNCLQEALTYRMLQLVMSQSAKSGEDSHKFLPGGRDEEWYSWWRHNMWRRSQIATMRLWVRMLLFMTTQSANSGEDAHKLLLEGREVGCWSWRRHNLQTQMKPLINRHYEAVRLDVAFDDVTIFKLRWRRSQIANKRPWRRMLQFVKSQ